MSIKRKRALKIGGIALAALLAVFSIVSLVAVQMLFDDTFARTAPSRPGHTSRLLYQDADRTT